MKSEVLIFRSGVKRYGIFSSELLHSEQIGVLKISEEYWPRSSSDSTMPQGVENYQIVIEAIVSTRSEAREAKPKAIDLADKLDKAWIY